MHIVDRGREQQRERTIKGGREAWRWEDGVGER